MKRWQKWTIGSGIVLVTVGFFTMVDVRPREEYRPEPEALAVADSIPAPPSAYGLPMAGFALEQGVLHAGATFSDLLSTHGVPMNTIHFLVEVAEPWFDVRRMRVGHPYAFIFPENDSRTPSHFVYEADQVEYVVFTLGDQPTVHVGRRPVTVTEHSIACQVTGALYNDLLNAGADPLLALNLADVFAWTVDMYRIQKGDVFSVVYKEKTVDGEPYGRPDIVAARYTSGGVIKEAYRFAQEDGTLQYFDQEGNSLRKAFLKAPLKFSRISSGFSSRRLHPVQKVMKAHLGTDYAAPYGTPILAVGDGVVEKAGRTAGNGNFVKVRHNGTYTTQYLHMRKILVREGQAVQQGDVIGEVGSTGLATGPHVCFRFWKNGVQVDHRKEEFPNTEPLAEARLPAFHHTRDSLAFQLDEAELVALNGKVVAF